MEYDTSMHEHHLHDTPRAPACTEDEPGFTQVDVSLVHHVSTIVLNPFDCRPMFLPIVGDASVEISE